MYTKPLWITVGCLGLATVIGAVVFTLSQEPVPTTQQNQISTNTPVQIPSTQTSTTKSTTKTPTFTLTKMDHDPYGVWQRTGSHYSDINVDQLEVYASPDSPYFAAAYFPTTEAKRTFVSLHGTDGTVYAGIHDEMNSADAMGTVIVAVQWLDFKTGTYADTATITHVIDEMYRILGNRLTGKSVLFGFSRGSAMNFQVAAADAAGAKRFVGVVASSGGIPEDGIVEEKGDINAQKKEEAFIFFSTLNNGTASPTTFADQHFFMYCGLKDEQWGTEMCEKMDRASTLVPQYGGIVDEFIRDDQGKHMDLVKNKEHYQVFLDWLEKITQ